MVCFVAQSGGISSSPFDLRDCPKQCNKTEFPQLCRGAITRQSLEELEALHIEPHRLLLPQYPHGRQSWTSLRRKADYRKMNTSYIDTDTREWLKQQTSLYSQFEKADHFSSQTGPRLSAPSVHTHSFAVVNSRSYFHFHRHSLTHQTQPDKKISEIFFTLNWSTWNIKQYFFPWFHNFEGKMWQWYFYNATVNYVCHKNIRLFLFLNCD